MNVRTLTWLKLSRTCTSSNATDALLVPGAPLLLRVKSGLTAADVDVVTNFDVESVLRQITWNPEASSQPSDGYLSVDVVETLQSWFRVAVFSDPPAERVLVMRMPAAQT